MSRGVLVEVREAGGHPCCSNILYQSRSEWIQGYLETIRHHKVTIDNRNDLLEYRV